MSNENKKRNKASAGPILMRTAGILFALTAITVWATSFMFAKYTTGGKGSDNSRVAAFNVDAAWTDETDPDVTIDVSQDFSKEEPVKYVLKLTNKSETAVRADLKFDFSALGTLASYVTIDGQSLTADGKYAYNLDPNGGAKEVTVKIVDFTLETGNTTSDGQAEKLDYEAALLVLTKNMKGMSDETEKLPFDVFAVFTQID